MDTKTCPSCGGDVPVSASTCKTCFHDFDATPRARSVGPMALLAAIAGMAVIAALTFGYLASQPADQRILVDQSTQTIQWVTKYKDGSMETDQLPWAQVDHLEHVTTQSGDFEIVAVTRTGERKVVQSDPSSPLRLVAEKYGELMGTQVVDVDNTVGGFGM